MSTRLKQRRAGNSNDGVEALIVACSFGRMERETRIELATNSLEGCDSTIELLPLYLKPLYGMKRVMVNFAFRPPALLRHFYYKISELLPVHHLQLMRHLSRNAHNTADAQHLRNLYDKPMLSVS